MVAQQEVSRSPRNLQDREYNRESREIPTIPVRLLDHREISPADSRTVIESKPEETLFHGENLAETRTADGMGQRGRVTLEIGG